MNNSDDPKVSHSKFDMLVYVAGMFYDQDFGTHDDDTIEEERGIEARIIGDAVPRKNRINRSSSSRKMVTPWTRVVEQQRSELQNPNAESELQNPNAESELSSSSSCVTQFKKRRQINIEDTSRKKGKIVQCLEEVEPTQTSPPEWLLRVMREENGYNPKLISTRKLYKTDVEKGQGRLSVPFRQVKTPDFLTEEETRIIDDQANQVRKEGVMKVDLVDPRKKKHVVDLKKWMMSENWYYVFNKGWNDVVAANRFKVGDFFPLWSFRSGSGKLFFALVPPPTASHGSDGASTSGE